MDLIEDGPHRLDVSEHTPAGPPSRRYVGVDVGGTNIKSVVLEMAPGRAEVLRQDQCPTEGDTPADVLAQVATIASSLAAADPLTSALGFSLPGAVDRRRGVTGVMPNLPGAWPGTRARAAVEDLTGIPTALINDARAFTLAESRLGAGRGLEVVVGVTLGTGVGGGIARAGTLFEGASGFAGELGHQILYPDGELCGCGNRGCVETVVNSRTLTERAGLRTVKEVFAEAAAGNARAVASIAGYVDNLAIALANVHALLCPDAFVVGGGIAEAGAELLVPLLERIRALTTFDQPLNVQVRSAALGPYSGAIGAALIAAEREGREECLAVRSD